MAECVATFTTHEMTMHTPVTPTDIENQILVERYCTAYDGVHTTTVAAGFEGVDFELLDDDSVERLERVTLCLLIARNGQVIIGESHCQDPKKYDAETGRTEARKDAINKMWPMAVYAARSAAEVPKRKPYTWGDVKNWGSQIDSRTYDRQWFVDMVDGKRYTGTLLDGIPGDPRQHILQAIEAQRTD